LIFGLTKFGNAIGTFCCGMIDVKIERSEALGNACILRNISMLYNRILCYLSILSFKGPMAVKSSSVLANWIK